MAVDPMMTQENPRGRYTILRELGRGAIGRVYAARDGSTGAFVALKTLDPALLGVSDANLAERFVKNARSAGRLRHRNIVKVYDAGEAGDTVYVAMELLEGESLRNMLDNRPLSIARAIQIFDDIASALAYAHEEGMLHRGVKPSNIIVLRSGLAKLGDFGIGQIGEAALPYMSPERVRGDPVDHRSDLFSLGAVFYEMLARRTPFEGNSAKEIKEKILRAEPPPPSEVNPHVPGALDGIVFGMLAAHPDKRFANARIVLRDLQRLKEGLGLAPGASAPTDEPNARVPPGRTEPGLRTPEPNRFRDPAPMPIPGCGAFDKHDARFMLDRERSSGSRAGRFAAITLILAALGVSVVSYYPQGLSELRILASGKQEAPATAAAPPGSTAPPPVEEATTPNPLPPKPLMADVSRPAQTETLLTGESRQAPTAGAAPAQEILPILPAAQATASIPAAQPGGTAKLIIAVSPQGEIYIDGKHYGTTPPVTRLDLEPGLRRIEIRSGSRKPYLTYMALEAGDQRRIRHDFAAKPIRPPT
jgi:eukaryotic-like serine/threonine-protein kinase